MAKRYELSDEAWAVVADLFTETHGRGRPRLSDRLMLDGVLWVLCSGAAWRDMPERFGPWSTVYQRFRGWRNQGTFDQMLKRLHLRLNEQGLIDLQTWMIDSTAVISYAKPLSDEVSIPSSQRGRPRKRCKWLLADKGYDAEALRRYCDQYRMQPSSRCAR